MAELLVVLLIITILVALAAPAYRTFITENRLKAAAEGLYSDMQLARSEAIRKQNNVYIIFQTGANWCYGLSDAATCDCGAANSCLLNGAEKVVNVSSYPGTTLATSGLTSETITFDGIRGSTGINGQVAISSGSLSVTNAVRPMGNIRICSGSIGGYSAC